MVTRDGWGHPGAAKPKPGSDERSNGETERKWPKPNETAMFANANSRDRLGEQFYSRIFCDATVTDEPMPQTCATWQRERRKLPLYISILDPILMLLDTTIPTA